MVEQHHDKSEAQILKENKKKLKGIYLPYELIRRTYPFCRDQRQFQQTL